MKLLHSLQLQCSSGGCRPEFRRYVEKKEKIVQRTFAKLDVDDSGYIDADELVSLMIWGLLLPSIARQARWLSTSKGLSRISAIQQKCSRSWAG